MSDRPFELQSREEEILAAIIDGTEYTDVPQSRIEYLLLELKAAIEAGSSDSPIKYKGSKANIAALPTLNGVTVVDTELASSDVQPEKTFVKFRKMNS